MSLKVIIIMLSITLVAGILKTRNNISSYIALNKSCQVLEKTIQELEQDIRGLEEEILRINQSKSYVSKLLKDRYHIVNENEEILFLAD